MEDNQIIELYWNRNEKAISEDGTELHNADVNEIITKNI